MQVSTSAIASASSIPKVNECKLEGGVTIQDKTNGIGEVIFSSELSTKYQKPTYKILIHGKKLIFPTCPYPSTGESLISQGSINIKFKHKNEFIKITEVDATGKTVFYVDPRNPVEGIAYDIYSHMPMEISEEIAMKKIESLKTDFPDFKGDIAVYNRHGVAVFGWDDNDNRYALYWANPNQEEKVKKIKCSICDRLRDGGTSFAKSEDGNVNFRYFFKENAHSLNAEPATRISLPK